jgi:penicillin-binding protein 1A
MEVKTGQVKAYVGGVDFFNFEYDMVGEGRRQVGSTIKPYLYSLAMENGMTPCDPISNSSAYSKWHVKGAGGGTLLLRNALKRSLNGASTQLMQRFSYDGRVFKDFLSRNYGINLPGVEPTPTLCLV